MNRHTTVYIVDDDVDSRASLAALVKSMGLNAVAFASGEEFLDEFRDDDPCCLVTDVRMPGMGGIELQRKLNELGNELPVIVITAHANITAAVKSMQEGAIIFLEKTCSEHDLCEAISLALRKSEDAHARKMQRAVLQEKMNTLTDGERQVLRMISDGKLNKQVALELDVSQRTVEERRQRIMKKLRVESFAELMRTTVLSEELEKAEKSA